MMNMDAINKLTTDYWKKAIDDSASETVWYNPTTNEIVIFHDDMMQGYIFGDKIMFQRMSKLALNYCLDYVYIGEFD